MYYIKKCLLLLFSCFVQTLSAQNYNLGFEDWNGTATFTNIPSSLSGFNCHPYLMRKGEAIFSAGSFQDQVVDAWSAQVNGIMRTTDAYSGNYAAVVHIWYHGSKGIMALGSTESTYVKLPKVKLNSKIYGVSGFYKYQFDSFAANDTFKKHSSLHIVTYQNTGGTAQQLSHDSLVYSKSDIYKPFSLSVKYPNTSVVPDSVSIWFESRGYKSGGTSCESAHFLTLDELQFHFAPLSTDSDFLKTAFKIFPNPADDIVNIVNENSYKIDSIYLTDNTGKIVKVIKSTAAQLDVSGLSPGIYLLQIQTEQGGYTEKIMIR